MTKTKNFALPTIFVFIILLLNSCTKYSAKTSSQSTSNNNQGYTPIYGNSGSSSGGSSSSGNSGSSTSSGTSGGGSNGSNTSGSGTSSNNVPQVYLQGFNYSNFVNSRIFASDTVALLTNGYYTTLVAGNTRLALVWGNHDATKLPTYFLNPYSFYSYYVFDETPSTLGETILNNGSLTVPSNVALVRFINIDPTTKNSSITFKLNNGNDKLTIPNRTYLDNKNDSSLAAFTSINPSTASIQFEVNGQTITSFNQYFQGGKKYTVLAAFSKQYNYSTYFVAQHN